MHEPYTRTANEIRFLPESNNDRTFVDYSEYQWIAAENAKLKAQRDFLIEIMHLVSEALIVVSRTDLDLDDQLTSAINNVKGESDA